MRRLVVLVTALAACGPAGGADRDSTLTDPVVQIISHAESSFMAWEISSDTSLMGDDVLWTLRAGSNPIAADSTVHPDIGVLSLRCQSGTAMLLFYAPGIAESGQRRSVRIRFDNAPAEATDWVPMVLGEFVMLSAVEARSLTDRMSAASRLMVEHVGASSARVHEFHLSGFRDGLNVMRPPCGWRTP